MNRRTFLAGVLGASAATLGAVTGAEAMPTLSPEAALAVGPREEIEQAAIIVRRRRVVLVRPRRRVVIVRRRR